MNEMSGSSLFVQKVAEHNRLLGVVVTKALGENENNLPDIDISSPEALKDMSPTELFLYSVSLKKDELAYGVEDVEDLQDSADAFNSAVSDTEMLTSMTDVFPNSDTPISDIVESDEADDFFAAVSELTSTRAGTDFYNGLVNAYLAETGFLAAQATTSDEVRDHHIKVVHGEMLRTPRVVEDIFAQQAGEMALAAMVEVGLLPENHEYAGIVAIGPNEGWDKDRGPCVVVINKPVEDDSETAFTLTIASEKIEDVAGELMSTIETRTNSIDLRTGQPSTVNKVEDPTPTTPEKAKFAEHCLDFIAQVLKQLESRNPTELQELLAKQLGA